MKFVTLFGWLFCVFAVAPFRADAALPQSPQLFSPGVISGTSNDGAPAFTPDGNTVLFMRFNRASTTQSCYRIGNGKFVTAGGAISSIDGALHIVTRFYGQDAAAKTALSMEHDGDGWRSGARAGAV